MIIKIKFKILTVELSWKLHILVTPFRGLFVLSVFDSQTQS